MRKKIKLVVLIVVSLTALLSILLFSVNLFHGKRQVDRLNTAFDFFERGEYQKAETLLIQVIQDDANQESAIVKLAQIMDINKHYYNSSLLWIRASQLNPLKSEYVDFALEALFRGRFFDSIYSSLNILKSRTALSENQKLLFGIAAFKLGKDIEAENIIRSLTDKKLLSSNRARLYRLLTHSGKKMTGKQLEQLKILSRCDDLPVAFESNYLLSIYHAWEKNIPEAVASLIRAKELNPGAGAVILGDFYFNSGDYSEAEKLYLESLSYEKNPVTAAKLGECWSALNQVDKIERLSEQYHVGSRSQIQLGYYLDALGAYLKQDYKLLASSLKQLPDEGGSTFRMAIEIASALHDKSPERLSRRLEKLNTERYSEDFVRRMVKNIMPFLAELVKSRKIDAAGKLAEQLKLILPDEGGLLKIILLRDFINGKVRELDLAAALKEFPEDSLILSIGTAEALKRNNFKEALKLVEKNGKISGENVEIIRQKSLALEGLNRLDEAERCWEKLLKIQSDNLKYLIDYMEFLIRNRQMDLLRSRLEAYQLKRTPEFDLLQSFGKFYLAYWEKNLTAQSEILTEIIKNPLASKADKIWHNLIYQTAFIAGEQDELVAAAELYKIIQDDYPDKFMVLANLSEIYAAMQKPEAALKYAEKSYEAAPYQPQAAECYAVRCFENKKYKAALLLLDKLALDKSLSVRGQGYQLAVLRILMKESFDDKNYMQSERYGRQLLKVVPTDAETVAFLQKIQKLKSGKKI